MAIPPLSDDVIIERVKIRAESKTLAEAARKAGITPSAFSNSLIQAARRGLDGSTPKALPAGFAVKGTSTLYKDGEEVLQWVKTSQDKTLEDVVSALKDVFDNYKGKSDPVKSPSKTDGDLLSVYPIADQHNGLLAWGQETGESYDLELGAKRLRSCASRLIDQSPGSKQAIILNLGDWQHTDDQKNMTPKSGNLLDVDGRYFKVLTTGIQLMMDVIELALAKHENVLIRNIPGNHDPHASVALTVALNAFYHNNKRVTVDLDPSDFFFHKFGKVLLGATHGHKLKPRDMAISMATRQREAWGNTDFHYFYYGHFHHERTLEVGDVRCECFQTLSAKDAWTHGGGYNSGQSLQSITHHKVEGEIGRHRINIKPVMENK